MPEYTRSVFLVVGRAGSRCPADAKLRNEEIGRSMVSRDVKGRRRFARHLERPSKTVKVICAVPGILLALEVGFGGLALLDNGEETVATGTAVIRECTRDPLTGWAMYRCDLDGADGSPIDTGMYQVDTLKALTPPHGRTDFEIRRTQGAKGTTSYLAVEKGTSRHSVFMQVLVVPFVFAAFFAVYISLTRLTRLTARAVRPTGRNNRP